MSLVHGSNLRQKEEHRTKYIDQQSRQYLREIRERYDAWNRANEALLGPRLVTDERDDNLIRQRVQLLEDYKTFIDQQKYAENFDSRSNLHSTVLEEFLYYLFRDLVADFGASALVGKSHTFKDVFFVPPNYKQMLERPHASIEIKDHDFIIGANVEARLRTSDAQPPSCPPDAVQENSGEPYAVEVTDGTEVHRFDLPAVAIECKTYLDKTMLEGSSRAAEELKARNPNAIYIVVMEWLKLTEAVNLRKYKVDQIYVLRRQRNTDREFRFGEAYVKNRIEATVVAHMFNLVRGHLSAEWLGGVAFGLDRGWLI